MISFQIADNYGGRKAVIYNNTVSSVVNYITGIQTLRAYGMTGVKNEALTRDLKEFSDINYNYEARGIPVSFFFPFNTCGAGGFAQTAPQICISYFTLYFSLRAFTFSL